MSYNTQIAAPECKYDSEGKFTLHRLHSSEAAVAAPVTAIDLYGVQDVNIGALSFGVTREVFQHGAGNERCEIQRQPRTDGNLTLLPGYVHQFLDDVLNKTFGVGGSGENAAIPIHFKNYPIGTIESVVRDADNATHLFSVVYQDVIIQEFDWNIAMENSNIQIPVYSYHDPFILVGGGSGVGAEIVLDKFSGDGSTTVFSLSGTPVDLVTLTDLGRDDWVFDDIVYVATKTSAADFYTRQTSGVTHSGGDITFTTAPASGTTIEVMYAIAHTA